MPRIDDAIPRRHRQVRAMLKVGVIGFGGGSALIPVLERELVNDRGGLAEGDFTRDTVIANITPGALPVKLAALAGTRLGGPGLRAPGLAVASAFAVALPGTVLTVGLLAFFGTLGDGGIRIVEGLSLGVTAFILFLLAHYALRVLRPVGRWRSGAVLIAAAVFLLTGLDATARLVAELGGGEPVDLPRLSALAVILLAIGLVAVVTLVQRLRAVPTTVEHDDAPGPSARRAILAAGVLAALAVVAGVGTALLVPGTAGFLGLVAASTVSSFGGGEAYVAVADGFFVAPGYVSSLDFYGQIVPVANALPGPILVKVAAGMAYSAGAAAGGPWAGIALATGALVVSAAGCAAIAVAVLAGYDKARRSRLVRNLSAVILPVVCGLLASTAVAMLHASAVLAERSGLPGPPVAAGTVVLAILVALLHARVRIPDLAVIAACAALSLAVVLAVGGWNA